MRAAERLVVAVLLAGLWSLPRQAGAIAYNTPDGLSFPGFDPLYDLVEGEEVELEVPAGGVISMLAVIRVTSHEDAIAGLELVLEDADGALETTAEIVPLWAQYEYDAITEYVAVVFRPATPLVAGAKYTGTLISHTSRPEQSMPTPINMVVVEPTGALSPAFEQLSFDQKSVPDPASEVCCETQYSFYGPACLPTLYVSHPVIGAGLTADRLTLSQGYSWAVGIDAEGNETPRVVDSFCGTVTSPSAWYGCGGFVAVEYPGLLDNYCLIAGVTSLVDGSEQRSEMKCNTWLGVDPPRDVTESALAQLEEITCLGPLLDADGTPYGPEEDEGCGCLAGQAAPAGWLVVVPLLWRRRRVSRS